MENFSRRLYYIALNLCLTNVINFKIPLDFLIIKFHSKLPNKISLLQSKEHPYKLIKFNALFSEMKIDLS